MGVRPFGGRIAGIYSGSTTNTAALAGIIDLVNQNYSGQELSTLTEEVVVGYSFSYPMGVLGGKDCDCSNGKSSCELITESGKTEPEKRFCTW
ncbi:MAG: hypothetical protein R3B93_12225 [Bacteroidia bacterium]